MANCLRCNGQPHDKHCVVCAVDEMARNHYFVGKWLGERDFAGEQFYHIGKARRHNKTSTAMARYVASRSKSTHGRSAAASMS